MICDFLFIFSLAESEKKRLSVDFEYAKNSMEKCKSIASLCACVCVCVECVITDLACSSHFRRVGMLTHAANHAADDKHNPHRHIVHTIAATLLTYSNNNRANHDPRKITEQKSVKERERNTKVKRFKFLLPTHWTWKCFYQNNMFIFTLFALHFQ